MSHDQPTVIVDSGASVKPAVNVEGLADRLEQFYQGTHITKAAETLRNQAEYIRLLEKLCDVNGLGIGRDLLTGEIISFSKAREEQIRYLEAQVYGGTTK